MGWAWKCCGNCHLSDKCELKEELVDKGELCEKYLPKPINEELDFAQEHKKIPVNLQIIKQELKTGHWIYDKSIENWKCSECGETPKTIGYVGDADFMKEHFKFCNHCGCRMSEVSE